MCNRIVVTQLESLAMFFFIKKIDLNQQNFIQDSGNEKKTLLYSFMLIIIHVSVMISISNTSSIDYLKPIS